MHVRALSVVTLVILLALPVRAQENDRATARIRQTAEEALARRYPDAARRLEVRVKRLRGEAGSLADPQLAFSPSAGLPKGHTQVPVRTPSGQQAGWALLYVAHYDSVMVTNRTLRADETVPDGALRATWTETTRFRGDPLRASAFRTMRRQGPVVATRRLSEGRTLRQRDLRPPYAAETGETVTMHYRRNGFAMRLDCKAREPGRPGEIIRLYSSTTQSTYRARLDEQGRATWIETL